MVAPAAQAAPGGDLLPPPAPARSLFRGLRLSNTSAGDRTRWRPAYDLGGPGARCGAHGVPAIARVPGASLLERPGVFGDRRRDRHDLRGNRGYGDPHPYPSPQGRGDALYGPGRSCQAAPTLTPTPLHKGEGMRFTGQVDSCQAAPTLTPTPLHRGEGTRSAGQVDSCQAAPTLTPTPLHKGEGMRFTGQVEPGQAALTLTPGPSPQGRGRARPRRLRGRFWAGSSPAPRPISRSCIF